MKKVIFSVLAIIFTSNVFAANCINQVNTAFTNAHPKFSVVSIKRVGQLAAGEDTLLQMGEIWNNSKYTVDVYYVESSFMARFGHGVLVEPKTCKVENIIEVLFE